LHVCYGDYSRIYPEILDFPVEEFDIELCNDDYEQLDVFKEPEFTKDLAMGVVDIHTREVESVSEIKANIKKALEIVPPERLTVSPDCGLKLLPREVAYGKMENLVTAARGVEAELDAGEVEIDAPPASAD
jgi:5-methyltetrahydropteroyltriglutamate--homocysteine methyltransferase